MKTRGTPGRAAIEIRGLAFTKNMEISAPQIPVIKFWILTHPGPGRSLSGISPYETGEMGV
jgi:hypothetical protein